MSAYCVKVHYSFLSQEIKMKYCGRQQKFHKFSAVYTERKPDV